MEQKNGLISVIQQITEQNKERERVEKHPIHEITPKELQSICTKNGLSDSDFYDFVSISLAITNGVCKNGIEGLKTAFKGELIVQIENIRQLQTKHRI